VDAGKTEAYSVYLQSDPQSASQNADAGSGREAMDADDGESVEVLLVPQAMSGDVAEEAENGLQKITKDLFDDAD